MIGPALIGHHTVKVSCSIILSFANIIDTFSGIFVGKVDFLNEFKDSAPMDDVINVNKVAAVVDYGEPDNGALALHNSL